MKALCRIGLHRFAWPPHEGPWPMLFRDWRMECQRGCGARKVATCFRDTHWADKHPEPTR